MVHVNSNSSQLSLYHDICNEQKRFLRGIYYCKDEAPRFAVTSYSSSHNPRKSTRLTRQRRALFSSGQSTTRRRRDASGQRAEARSHRGYQAVIVAAPLNHLFFLKKAWLHNYLSIIIYVSETLFR